MLLLVPPVLVHSVLTGVELCAGNDWNMAGRRDFWIEASKVSRKKSISWSRDLICLEAIQGERTEPGCYGMSNGKPYKVIAQDWFDSDAKVQPASEHAYCHASYENFRTLSHHNVRVLANYSLQGCRYDLPVLSLYLILERYPWCSLTHETTIKSHSPTNTGQTRTDCRTIYPVCDWGF